MNPVALAEALKERARGEGFDAVGVATATRLDRDTRALETWLERGDEAGMTWMNREPTRRGDPRVLVPGCRSVVVVAMNYGPGKGALADDPERAKVARYARGRDYHKVMGKRLRRLAAWLEDVSGAESRSFVDTGPVLERAWAERAGVGWIGKNANLLTRTIGSWILLGEILTVAELQPDEGPHEEFCGTCNACVDACPTDAITADATVDSNLCISYWTIEHRGPVPEDKRPGMGDWIFGCDICQEVCPWNVSFAREAHDDPFESRDDLQGLDPVKILGMDEATFREQYSGTPLMRAKWEGMRRNACVVLGNRGRRSDLAALRVAAGDPDPVVREHARWAIRRIGPD